ncbi:MAG: DUF5808 domain-containing protein [Myxococcota bacterium]
MHRLLAHPALAPVVLALSTGALVLLRPTFPERWIVHWGVGNVPDGWATRDGLGVFFPVMLGAGIQVFLELMVLLMRSAQRSLDPRLAALGVAQARIAGTMLAVMMGALALALPLLNLQTPWLIILGAFGWVGLLVVVLVVYNRRELARLRAEGVPGLEHYRGILYVNPNDERLWVPKLAGMGWTLNFAHPRAWLLLVVLISPALIAIVALMILPK